MYMKIVIGLTFLTRRKLKKQKKKTKLIFLDYVGVNNKHHSGRKKRSKKKI